MQYDPSDTICAVASPAGGALRGIVRLAGPEVAKILKQVFAAEDHRDWDAVTRSQVVSGCVRLATLKRSLEVDLYYWPGPKSYTGGPLAELHLIGSPPLLTAVMETLCERGARPAERGEFTLRAFLSGRLDLTQAEAVLGVIDAGGGNSLDTALRQLAGGLGGPLSSIRDQLLDLLAHLEAGLDFVDEDIEFVSAQRVQQLLGKMAGELAGVSEQLETRADTTQTIRVVLRGSANVGKSSLFNALLGNSTGSPSHHGAIVSSIKGTTRDYVTAPLILDGMPVELVDTAGVTEATADEPLHQASQQTTKDVARQADCELLCLDASRSLDAWERQAVAETPSHPRLVLLTKSDLDSERIDRADISIDVRTSCQSGEGIELLREAIGQLLQELALDDGQVVTATAVRCRESIRKATDAVAEASELAAATAGDELVAAAVRIALDELGLVVGAVYTNDLLDRIFGQFCIGK